MYFPLNPEYVRIWLSCVVKTMRTTTSSSEHRRSESKIFFCVVFSLHAFYLHTTVPLFRNKSDLDILRRNSGPLKSFSEPVFSLHCWDCRGASRAAVFEISLQESVLHPSRSCSKSPPQLGSSGQKPSDLLLRHVGRWECGPGAKTQEFHRRTKGGGGPA